MKFNDLFVRIKNKEGKNRIVKDYPWHICMGTGTVEEKNLKENAIQEGKDSLIVEKDLCSKCYLCLLKPGLNFSLDDQNFPKISKDSSTCSFKEIDAAVFERFLQYYSEEFGISKWLTLLFVFYGFKKVFKEVSIPKSSLSNDYGSKIDVYKKGPVADIELEDDDFLILFENKKFDPKLKWLKDSSSQILLYASSAHYDSLKKNKKVYFVICCNGVDDMTGSYKKEIFFQELSHISKKRNSYVSLLNSQDFYKLMIHDLKNKTVNKKNILNLIKSKVVDFENN